MDGQRISKGIDREGKGVRGIEKERERESPSITKH